MVGREGDRRRHAEPASWPVTVRSKDGLRQLHLRERPLALLVIEPPYLREALRAGRPVEKPRSKPIFNLPDVASCHLRGKPELNSGC